ncbi:MAG: hypothetical protein ACXAC7_24065 [Candidatus Hodarchaeales archaeon]|jgi:hypothetical protein
MALVVPPELVQPFVGNIINTEEKLTEDEIAQVANNFNQDVNIATLTPNRVSAIANYFKDNVQNKKLRALLLDELNVLRAIPEQTGNVPPRQEDIVVDRFIDPLSPPLARQVIGDPRLFVPKQDVIDITDKVERLDQAYFDENQRIRDEFKRQGNKENAWRTNVWQAQHELDKIVSLPIIVNELTVGDRISLSGTRARASNIHNDLRDRQMALNAGLNRVRQIIQRVKRDPRAEISIEAPEIEQVLEEKIPTTKENLKEFTSQLQRELSKISSTDQNFIERLGREIRRGIAVHKPTDEHKIGSIKILSDSLSKVKEIIIEPHTTGKDILKLAHALGRENGVLLKIDGTDVVDIHGENKDFEKIANVIIKLLNDAPKGHALRLVYKPSHSFGGHFVGGMFTNMIYNKPEFSDVFHKRLPFGGFIGIPESSIGFRHNFLTLPVRVK